MKKKRVLTPRELEVEKILQRQLQEYVIRANVRLADVVHAGSQFKWMSGYHLDFVICDQHANPIAAVELDDSTHDTEDGKRRDSNKNRWLEQANIKLIRIRTQAEAENIRSLITSHGTERNLNKTLSMHEAQPNKLQTLGWGKNTGAAFKSNTQRPRGAKPFLFFVFLICILLITIYSFTTKNIRAIQNVPPPLEQKIAPKQIVNPPAQTDGLAWKKQQAEEITLIQKKLDADQPHYERKLIRGKSAQECSHSRTITNESILCMKDHYETVLVPEEKTKEGE